MKTAKEWQQEYEKDRIKPVRKLKHSNGNYNRLIQIDVLEHALKIHQDYPPSEHYECSQAILAEINKIKKEIE